MGNHIPQELAVLHTLDRTLDKDRMAQLFASLRARAEANLVSSNTVAAHNSYAAYNYMLLCLATGRQREDQPLWYKSHYCSIRNEWFIDDNPPWAESNPRIVHLPLIASEQVNAYEAHLQGLVSKAGDQYPRIRKAVQSALQDDEKMPFLFLLRHNDLVPYAPSSDDLCDVCEELLAIELNQHRDFLNTELRNYGLHDHSLELMLGRPGEPQLGVFTGQSVADLREISESVGRLMSDLKISPLKGFAA